MKWVWLTELKYKILKLNWKSKSECFKAEVISGFLSPYLIACMAMFTKKATLEPDLRYLENVCVNFPWNDEQ